MSSPVPICGPSGLILFILLLLVIKHRGSDAVCCLYCSHSSALTVCPGGVVEAYPPSELVSCLTVDLLLDPGGEVTMLSCGDQLQGSCQLEAIGSTVPQTSVNPETLQSISMRVGRACLQRLIVGYVSVDLATFLNRNTGEQKVSSRYYNKYGLGCLQHAASRLSIYPF